MNGSTSSWRERAGRRRERRRRLAAKQAWWLIGGAAALVAWGRISARWLDPVGPTWLDWGANLVRSLEFQLGCGVALLLVGAALRRAWAQVLAALAVVSVTVAMPFAHGRLPGDATGVSAPGDPALRLLSVNVLVSNTDVEATAQRLRATEADVILVQEYGALWAERLPIALSPEWRLVVAAPREDSFGVAAFVRSDRFPSLEGEIYTVGDSDLPQVRLAHDVSDRGFVLHGVHVQPPISPGVYRQSVDEVRVIRSRVRDERQPVVIAGDFNAVGGSAIDRAMQAGNFDDAWERAGRGPGWTWPRNGLLRFVPGVRIDHVYVGREWNVAHIERLPAAGSDHRPLLVDLHVAGR